MKTRKKKAANSTDQFLKQNGILLVVIGVVVVLGLGAMLLKPAAKPEPKAGSLSGGIWLTKGSGESNILRGHEIALCTNDVSIDEFDHLMVMAEEDFQRQWKKHVNVREVAADEAQKLRDRGVRISTDQMLDMMEKNNPEALHPKLTGFGQLRSALPAIISYVATKAVRVCKSDINGKYELTEIAPGDYQIFASYDTAFSKGFWLIPVSISPGLQSKLDLDNSNMTAIFNDEKNGL